MDNLTFPNVSGFIKAHQVWATLALLAITLGGGFLWGSCKGRAWADSAYLQERDKSAAKVAMLEASAQVHEDNEKKLAAENQLLKNQNEATAEILKKNDAAIAGDAKKLADLQTARADAFNKIDAETDTDAQVCGVCADLKKSGFPLSEKLCGRCPK